MAKNTSVLVIPLNGTGTEIPTLNVTDFFDSYRIEGAATSTGNYAIVPTGTPQEGTTFEFIYKATLDITTNGNTFSIFGTALTQNQLLSKLYIQCYYNGATWDVTIIGSLDQDIIEAANIVAGAVSTAAIASNSISTAKLINNSVTNAKLAQMSTLTVKANVTGGTADPSDVSICSLTSLCSWGLTGNAGTTAGTNFIGTTDDQDVVFKRNGSKSGLINDSDDNTAFGFTALSNITSGANNSAFGDAALIGVTTANNNSAFGSSALANISSAGNNSAFGTSSQQLTSSGTNNSSLGCESLYNLLTGVNNVGVGYQAGYTSTGNRNTFIGSTATTLLAAGNNRIALGYGAQADADFQFALPDNVTIFKWRGNSYTLPSADGTAGQSLKTDGSGTLYWG